MLKKVLCVITVLALLPALFGCSFKPQEFSGSFFDTFDTVITLYGYTKDATEFNKYASLCHETFLYYHKLFDIYNSYEGINNLKTVNDNAGICQVTVEPELMEFLQYCLSVYKKAEGGVNIAMGSVLSIWHKYRTQSLEDPSKAAIPPESVLYLASQLTDIEKLVLNEESSTVFLKDKGMSIDAGAVAKGYACQKAAQKLISEGFESFVISAGGNVYAYGAPADSADGWSIGIKNPDTLSSASLIDTVKVSEAAVVTAGSYEQYYTVNGKTYSHIIDPKTLMPAENYLSVTVIAEDSALADYLATELFLCDYETGLGLCRRFGVEAMWVLKDGSTYRSDGYGEYSENFKIIFDKDGVI